MLKSYEEMAKELREWAKKRGLKKMRNRDEYRLVLTGADEELRYAQFFFDIQLLKDRKSGLYNARILANGWNSGNAHLFGSIFNIEGMYEDNDNEVCLANVVTLSQEHTPDKCLEMAIDAAEDAACLLAGAEWSDWLKWHYGIGHFLRDLRRVLKGKSVKEICRDE
jgi:hypothetical protein